jgi:hypothetical protein
MSGFKIVIKNRFKTETRERKSDLTKVPELSVFICLSLKQKKLNTSDIFEIFFIR